MAKTSSTAELGILNLNVISKEDAIYQYPQNITVENGDKAVFTCKTQPSLKEMVSWVKKTGDDSLEILSLASEFLELTNVTFEDEGYYACVVGNEVSHVQKIAYLKVVEKPLPVPKLIEAATENYITIIIIVTFVLLFMGGVIFCLSRKWKQEQMKKKHAIESAQALTQWTKKVIIGKLRRKDYSPLDCNDSLQSAKKPAQIHPSLCLSYALKSKGQPSVSVASSPIAPA